jgi:amidohydrolase
MRTSLPATILAVASLALVAPVARAQGGAAAALHAEIDRRTAQVNDKVVAWRRDIHAHPELGGREVRTAKLVADHLRALGIETRTGVAHTGVVGVLVGGKPGPVVALRADMDALPVTEQVNLPFASKERTQYDGHEVGVMHACGHDNHVAILMGVAEVLAGMRRELPGTVKFIFQPAEEGSADGTEGGAQLMLQEGAFDAPTPDAVFGLHVWPYPVGSISYHPGATLASSDELRIIVHGKQTHGAQPWKGVDPVVVASQIVLGLQTITARQTDVTKAPAIVTIGSISGGNRGNIIPDSVVMVGTIRAYDDAMQKDIHARITRTAELIAQSAGASAEVHIGIGYPVTVNDPALAARMAPTLERVAGVSNVHVVPPVTASEDFSYFARRAPGLFVFLGIVPKGVDPATAAPNHSPRFFADESALPVGVRALSNLAVDYLLQGKSAPRAAGAGR